MFTSSSTSPSIATDSYAANCVPPSNATARLNENAPYGLSPPTIQPQTYSVDEAIDAGKAILAMISPKKMKTPNSSGSLRNFSHEVSPLDENSEQVRAVFAFLSPLKFVTPDGKINDVSQIKSAKPQNLTKAFDKVHDTSENDLDDIEGDLEETFNTATSPTTESDEELSPRVSGTSTPKRSRSMIRVTVSRPLSSCDDIHGALSRISPNRRVKSVSDNESDGQRSPSSKQGTPKKTRIAAKFAVPSPDPRSN